MLASIDRSTLQGKRDFAMLNLQARLGLRAVELTRLNVGDIHNGGADTLICIWEKGREGREDELVMMPSALEPLAEYLSARAAINGQPAAEDPIFCSDSDRNRSKRLTTHSISRIAKIYLHKIGAVSPRLSGHSLRHFFVTCQVEKGVPLQTVMASARHLSVSTTMRYFHAFDRIQNAGERFVDF
jgi:site-specific recombinase XerD